MSTDMRVCIFCRKPRKLSREDAVPKWIGRFFAKNAGEGSVVTHTYEADGRKRKWKSGRISILVRRPCIVCNTGWMSRLEAQTKPILLRLIRGHPASLSRRDQFIVGRWAAKTAAMWRCNNPQWRPAQEELDWIMTKPMAPPNHIMWLGRYAGEQMGGAYFAHHDLELPEPVGGGKSGADTSVFWFGRLVFVTIQFARLDVGTVVEAPTAFSDYLVQAWPPIHISNDQATPSWPPRFGLVDFDLATIAKGFGNGLFGSYSEAESSPE
jgi:hypothetical protein